MRFIVFVLMQLVVLPLMADGLFTSTAVRRQFDDLHQPRRQVGPRPLQILQQSDDGGGRHTIIRQHEGSPACRAEGDGSRERVIRCR